MSGDALRIAAIRCEPYALPFVAPFVTAGGALKERRGVVVRVQEAGGAWGVGEAAPLPHFGGETQAACEDALARWAAALPGTAVPLGVPAAQWAPGAGLVTDPAATPAACHGLEGAVLDLAARHAGLSLARWLHPRAARAVDVNATLGADAPEAAAAAARAAVMAGFRTLKLKVGVAGPTADAARLRAVRAAAGPDVRLRIDANGAWSAAQAATLLEQWAPLGLEYVEQPVPAADADGLAWLAAHAPVPIAADEAIRGPADAERLLAAGAAQVLVLKPMLLGGALATLRLARQALARGLPVVITTVLEGLYGRLAALHIAAAVAALHAEAGLVPPACGLATGDLLAADLRPAAETPPGPQGGQWRVPEGPGLGCT